MRSTTPARTLRVLVAALLAFSTAVPAAGTAKQEAAPSSTVEGQGAAISARQLAIVPIAAFAASGDIPRLNLALNQGMDAGVTISDAREILVQVYAYAGFPRSLNAMSELMAVLEARRKRGIEDAPGRRPGKTIPTGEDLLAAGTANQTRLLGAPAAGPLFEFEPAMDEFLKTHLFGDIFERDNLDWADREIATIAMLATLKGVDSQLRSHLSIGLNAGLTVEQLNALAHVLNERVGKDAGGRARAALEARLSAEKP